MIKCNKIIYLYFRWKVWKWSDCSGCLFVPGIRTRIVECVKEVQDLTKADEIIVSRSQCCGNQPSSIQICYSVRPCVHFSAAKNESNHEITTSTSKNKNKTSIVLNNTLDLGSINVTEIQCTIDEADETEIQCTTSVAKRKFLQIKNVGYKNCCSIN